MVNFNQSGLNVVLALSVAIPASINGFAYAPNFITKIISESTGKEPFGLLDIASKSDEGVEESGDGSGTSIETNLILDTPIITRFPPEPNGYLHLGHAKAVSFNFAVARMFAPDGRCNMRLDDTNPSKENQEYIDSILEDVRWIQSGTEAFLDAPFDNENAENNGPWFGKVHKTSDNFQLIYECTKELIKSGDAYVDSLSAEEMREYRGSLTEPGKDSPFRTRSIEENLELFGKVSMESLTHHATLKRNIFHANIMFCNRRCVLVNVKRGHI